MKHPGLTNKVNENFNEKFEWSKENFSKINIIINKYPPGREQSAVIPLLDLAQRQNKGWLSKNSLEKVAETLSMSYVRVLEVATFYSMFNLQPIGENFVQICRTTPCWLRGSDKLLDVAREVSEINIGETSADNKFTIVEVECLGACCNAPMVQINDTYYEDLDEVNFRKILEDLKNNIPIKNGSQIGRNSSHPKRNF